MKRLGIGWILLASLMWVFPLAAGSADSTYTLQACIDKALQNNRQRQI